MKEPTVIIHNVVAPTTNPPLPMDNIAAGAIVSDYGPTGPVYCSNKQEVIKNFTEKNKLERTTDSSLIHAAAIAEFMPIVVSRTTIDDGMRVGIEFKSDGSTNQILEVKGIRYIKDSSINVLHSTLVDSKKVEILDNTYGLSSSDATFKVSTDDAGEFISAMNKEYSQFYIINNNGTYEVFTKDNSELLT